MLVESVKAVSDEAAYRAEVNARSGSGSHPATSIVKGLGESCGHRRLELRPGHDLALRHDLVAHVPVSRTGKINDSREEEPPTA